MGRHVFCSDLCLERGEPLAGLGDAPQRMLMFAWPRGKWRTPRWESVDLSPELSQALHDAAHAGLHVALVDKVEAPGALPTLHALPENIRADFDDEAELIGAIRGYIEGRLFAGERDERTTIVCCTDSRRDACCARHGFSTYKALTAIADTSAFNIVQATHIGGCRFAASLVVMPQRQRYGRMSAEHATGFLAALTRGEVYLPTYRGRTDRPEAEQVAELAALKWAEAHGHRPRAVAFRSEVPEATADGEHLTIEAIVAGTELSIQMHAQDFLVQGSCEAVAEGGGSHSLRWCLDKVSERADEVSERGSTTAHSTRVL